MTIQEKIQELSNKYLGKGGIIGIGVGVAGINTYVHPDQADESVLQQVMKDGQPFGIIILKTTLTPTEVEAKAKEAGIDGKLARIKNEGDVIAYCFYLPGPNKGQDYVLQEDQLMERT